MKVLFVLREAALCTRPQTPTTASVTTACAWTGRDGPGGHTKAASQTGSHGVRRIERWEEEEAEEGENGAAVEKGKVFRWSLFPAQWGDRMHRHAPLSISHAHTNLL